MIYKFCPSCGIAFDYTNGPFCEISNNYLRATCPKCSATFGIYPADGLETDEAKNPKPMKQLIAEYKKLLSEEHKPGTLFAVKMHNPNNTSIPSSYWIYEIKREHTNVYNDIKQAKAFANKIMKESSLCADYIPIIVPVELKECE